VSEIPDEEFKVFMAIARYCILVLTHVSTPLTIRSGSTYIIDGKSLISGVRKKLLKEVVYLTLHCLTLLRSFQMF